MAREPVIDRGLPADALAVHALVLGAGHYANGLPGLDSAAASAAAFADWVSTRHARAGVTLGSLDMLASQPSGQPVTWRGVALDPPTLANVQDAVDAWHARADAHEGNLAIFYFCGHGIAVGGLQSLLLSDVDLTSASDPFRGAIDFDNFVTGMDGCGAREQLYVLDACRELPLGFAKWDQADHLGDSLVRTNLKRRAALGPRTHVVLHATSATQKAWAGPGRAWFTDALLTALDGPAADNRFTARADLYSVSTRDIVDSIKYLARNDFIDASAGPQMPVRKGEGDFDFHTPAVPVVPVLVTRAPPTPNQGARFLALRGAQQVDAHDCSDQRPWRARLPIGEYEFRRDPDAITARVVVPSTRVELP